MTTIVLTDRLLHDALSPAPTSVRPAELAQVVSQRARSRAQARRWMFPWRLSPAATFDEARRVRLLRVGLLAALLAASAGIAMVGARLLVHPLAPPQIVLLQGGQGFSIPLGGGDRVPIPALRGRNIVDFSIAPDGLRMATLSDPHQLEIWDAADVFNGQPAVPILIPNAAGVQILDTGAWRPDGESVLLSASDHGARRILLLDIATGSMTQVSPPNVSVDDWQPSFDGRWIEIAGQSGGHFGLFLVDLTTGTSRELLGTEGGRIPEGGALGWSPDSSIVTLHMEIGQDDAGIWRLDLDGTGLRQVTPAGQPASWMNWSPDGEWLAYETEAANPTCSSSSTRRATWIVRPDGTDAHSIAEDAVPLYWAEDSRSMIVASAVARPDAPRGGVVHAYLDGSPPTLVYPYTEADNNGDGKNCYRYGAITKFYRALARGIH